MPLNLPYLLYLFILTWLKGQLTEFAMNTSQMQASTA